MQEISEYTATTTAAEAPAKGRGISKNAAAGIGAATGFVFGVATGVYASFKGYGERLAALEDAADDDDDDE